MRALVRLIAIWCFAVWWAVLSLGGPGAHLLLDDECCSSPALSASASSEDHSSQVHVVVCKHGHRHAHAGSESARSSHSTGEQPQHQHRHDSAHCAACQFFASPQSMTLLFELPTVDQAGSLTRVPAPAFVACERVEPWNSRAPPATASLV